MTTWLAIVNPRSGGRSRRSVERLVARLKSCCGEVALTSGPGHATDLARAGRDRDGIVVAGGDGTIFEVLQGIDRRRQRLRIVPRGRGNSLARDLGLGSPQAGTQAIDLLELSCKTKDGTTTDVVSASTIALGYPAQLAELAGSRFRAFRSWSYPVAAAFARPRRRTVRVAYGDELEKVNRLTGFLVSNTRHAARFVAFPEADCRDGSFEVMEMRDGLLGHWMHDLSALLDVPLHRPEIRSGVTRVRAEVDEPELLLIDGELRSDVVALEVRIAPASLSLARDEPAA